MRDKPESQPQEPAPRPPRQPDLALITTIEKGQEPVGEEQSDAENGSDS